MFTGIITHLGTVESLKSNREKDLLLAVSTKKIVGRKLEIGCSIACNGACLTLIKKETKGAKNIFSFQASKETLTKTTLKNWRVGDLINLEFALRFGDELGGHLVLGHVDDTSKIKAILPIKDSHKFTFSAPKELMKFIAPKGSITIDGASLTVNEVTKNSFSINLIPHSLKNTSFQNAKVGNAVNIEIDLMARYLERLLKSSKH